MEKMIEANYKYLFHVALKITRSKETALDLLHTSIIKMIEKRDLYKEEGKFTQWACTVMRNLYITDYKRSIRQHAFSIDNVTTLDQYDHMSYCDTYNLLSETLKEILNSIDPVFRDTFLYTYLYGYEWKKVAEIMQCPHNTVLTRSFRARGKLRLLLESRMREAEDRVSVAAGAEA